MKYLIFSIILFWSYNINAQVAIDPNGGTADSSAIFDVRSTDKGFLIPRTDQNHIDKIENPAEGLMIYNTTTGSFMLKSGYGKINISKNGIGYREELNYKKSLDAENDDDIAESISPTSDGGVIIAGYTTVNTNGQTSMAMFFLKLTDKGVADKNFGIDGKVVIDGYYTDIIYSVKQTFDGGYIAAGYSSSGNIGAAMCLVKLKPSGQLDSQFGTNGILLIRNNGYTVASDIKQTADSGFIVTGYFNNGNDYDLLITKLTKTGGFDYNFNGTGILTMGKSNDYERAFSVDVTNNGDYFITGYTNNGANGGDDIIIVKLKPDGSIQPNFNGGKLLFGSAYDEKGYSVAALDNGGCVITGTKTNPYSFFAVKFNADGTFLQSNYYYSTSYDLYGYSIENINDTAFLIAGTAASHSTSHSYALLAKLNSSLELSQVFGNNGAVAVDNLFYNNFNSACKTTSGDFAAAGNTRNSDDDNDFFIVKTNGAGYTCGNAPLISITKIAWGQNNIYLPATGNGNCTTGTFSPTVSNQGILTSICSN